MLKMWMLIKICTDMHRSNFLDHREVAYSCSAQNSTVAARYSPSPHRIQPAPHSILPAPHSIQPAPHRIDHRHTRIGAPHIHAVVLRERCIYINIKFVVSHIFLRKICYVEHYIEHALPVLAAICNTHTSHLGGVYTERYCKKEIA